MDRRRFLGKSARLGLAAVKRVHIARAEAREIGVAEPVHSIFGYLPLCIRHGQVASSAT